MSKQSVFPTSVHGWLVACVVLVGSVLTPAQAQAGTFVVDIAIDDGDSHDAVPGNGVCADAFGQCPLRAAIEEANALAGPDVILFAADFAAATTTLSASEGPLPVITGRVFIIASGITAYNSDATDIGSAPPQMFIDGSALTSPSASGLVFDGASGSEVTALGIVNFPNHGIDLRNGSNNMVIRRNYIGYAANGAAAGNGRINGGDGINGYQTGGHQIGVVLSGENFTGLGNVISSNAGHGINLFQSSNNIIHGNRIGVSGNGSTARGNAGFGIQLLGNNNQIGAFTASAAAGNNVAANGLGSISVIGDGNTFYANQIAKRAFGGGAIPSAGNGIGVSGQLNTIGTGGRGANTIYEQAGAGIRLGLIGGLTGNSNIVNSNRLGLAGSFTAGPAAGNHIGIHVENGSSNAIINNVVVRSADNGILIRGNDNSLAGNLLGYYDNGPVPVAEPNKTGITVLGDDNVIGAENNPNLIGGNTINGMNLVGDDNQIIYNHIGVDDAFKLIGNERTGLTVSGHRNRIRHNVIGDNVLGGLYLSTAVDSGLIENNHIGIAPDGSDIGNGSVGIWVVAGSARCTIRNNTIAFNLGDGIGTDATVASIGWYGNRMYGNSGQGYDLGNDGVTPNDFEDVDEGPNRRQNYPLIHSAFLDTVPNPPQLTLTYSVDTITTESTYPLFIDFYWTDRNEVMQGRYFLRTEPGYDTPNEIRTVAMNMPAGTAGGLVAGIAVDSALNASELSEPVMFGAPPDDLFADGFE